MKNLNNPPFMHTLQFFIILYTYHELTSDTSQMDLLNLSTSPVKQLEIVILRHKHFSLLCYIVGQISVTIVHIRNKAPKSHRIHFNMYKMISEG